MEGNLNSVLLANLVYLVNLVFPVVLDFLDKQILEL